MIYCFLTSRTRAASAFFSSFFSFFAPILPKPAVPGSINSSSEISVASRKKMFVEYHKHTQLCISYPAPSGSNPLDRTEPSGPDGTLRTGRNPPDRTEPPGPDGTLLTGRHPPDRTLLDKIKCTIWITKATSLSRVHTSTGLSCRILHLCDARSARDNHHAHV